MASPKKILIVEDEPALAQILLTSCQKKGYHVIKAENGHAGLTLAIKEQPDLILLDLVLPGMDGMTMLSKIRQSNRERNVPVIILTNLNADDRIMKGVIENEPSYYLVKSDSKIEDVMQKIDGILSQERARAGV